MLGESHTRFAIVSGITIIATIAGTTIVDIVTITAERRAPGATTGFF